jgi:hypothetical protein
MRALTVLLLISLSVAFCQTTPEKPTADSAVRRMLTPMPEGIFLVSGWDAKELPRYGDASAVAVSKQIAGKDLSRAEIRQILLIIQISFEAPLQVTIESDRSPTAATDLVGKLERMPAASGLTEEFAGTKKLLRRVSKEKAR